MENDKKKMMWMFVGLCVAVVGLMVYLVVSLRNSSAVNYEVSAPRFAVESARRRRVDFSPFSLSESARIVSESARIADRGPLPVGIMGRRW